MSSNAVGSDGKVCQPVYTVRDYFLALLVIVVCLVILRMLLYVSYYTWLRITARRREQQLNPSANVSRMDVVESRSQPLHNMGTVILPSPPSQTESRVCVIVPGKDRPTFVAMPAPFAPSRHMDSQEAPAVMLEMVKS